MEYELTGSLEITGDFELTIQMQTDIAPERLGDLGAIWTSFNGVYPVVSFQGRMNNIYFEVNSSNMQSPEAIQIVTVNDNSSSIQRRDIFSVVSGVENPGHINSIDFALSAPNGSSSLDGLYIPSSPEDVQLDTFDSMSFGYTTRFGGTHSGTIESFLVRQVPSPATSGLFLIFGLQESRRKRGR